MIDVAYTSRSPQNSIHREKDRAFLGRQLSFLVGKEDGVDQQPTSSGILTGIHSFIGSMQNGEAQESLPGPME
jgi:hypothetical protein